MSLVLAIVFGLWFLCIVILDKEKQLTKADRYEKNHPPLKKQEEYLLVCKYYAEYLLDPSHKDPGGDALYRARMDIYNQGFRPSPLEAFGLDRLNDFRDDMRKCGYGMVPMCPPDYEWLMKLRKYDETHLNIEYFHGGYSRFPAAWKAYCESIDKMYDECVVQSYATLAGIEVPENIDYDSFYKEEQSIIQAKLSRNAIWLPKFQEKYQNTIFWGLRFKAGLYHSELTENTAAILADPSYNVERMAAQLTVAECKKRFQYVHIDHLLVKLCTDYGKPPPIDYRKSRR